VPTDIQQRVLELKGRIEESRQLRYKYEARLEEIGRQRQRVLQELADMGLRPEDLESEIARLQAEVNGLLEDAASLLPPDVPKE